MMKTILCTCFFILSILAVNGYPYGYIRRPARSSAQQHRAFMLEGYYGHQLNRRSGYVPQGAMTAFATGDTVATGTYLGDQYDPITLESIEDDNVKEQPLEIISTEPTIEQATVAEVDTTSRKPKTFNKKKPVEDEEDEDEESYWPFPNNGRRGLSYNAFFPIMFGGYSKTRAADSNGGYPGAATAIANSFSTGKGGVASSHATAYGDPYMSALFKNGKFNFKKRNQEKEQ